jgi:hypothetical protein
LARSGDPEPWDLNGWAAVLHEIHTCCRCDLRSGGANHTELKPEAASANRNGIARNLFALLGAPKDINETDPLASGERCGSSGEGGEAGEAGDAVAQCFGHRVDWKDLPPSCCKSKQDAVRGAVWPRGGANDRNGATLRQHAAHERVRCGGRWGTPFGGLDRCP